MLVYNGKNGILPQFLKGQMYQESYKADNTLYRTYRYEPWQDLRFRNQPNRNYAEDYMKQPYWVNENGWVELGAKDVPTDHKNVRPLLSFSSSMPYPNSQILIGEYVADNLDQYYKGKQNNSKRQFSRLLIYGPDTLQWVWDKLAEYYGEGYKAGGNLAI